ncbi:MAG: tetratricopeptide repeat protein, partial [Candidatus Omnitrophica bacterium]|nr:tetratricopeptide repeat protein [Candidatus Omnitrophota bacterium]
MKNRLTKILLVYGLLSTAYGLNFSYALSLKDAQRDYLAGNYEESIAKASRLRENDEVLYFLALVHMKNSDYQQARSYLDKLIQRFPNSSFHDLTIFKLADIYFLEKDYEQAQGLYQQLELNCPKLGNKSLLFLRLAQVASRQGDW